jgi:hypothetical protein
MRLLCGGIMKVKFKGKTLDIKNESSKKSEFYANWNGYTIEVNKYDIHYFDNGSQKIKYEGYCVNPLGSCICDCVTHNKISEAVQDCFDNIALDIDDLKSTYDEIGEWLNLVKEWL